MKWSVAESKRVRWSTGELEDVPDDAILVTAGRETCGITKFATRLSTALYTLDRKPAAPIAPELVNRIDASGRKVVVNVEPGVLPPIRALKLARRADRSVVIMHTIRRGKDDRVLRELREHAYVVAMHPYAEDYVDEVVFHPGTYSSAREVVTPPRVTGLAVFGLIRPGKGIEAAIKLAAELGLDVYVRGEVQDPDVAEELRRFASLVGVGLELDDRPWSADDVRSAVRGGFLPVIPSVATGFSSIWASGTEADLLGCRVPYLPYPVFGGHNPCAYAIEYGGPSHVTLYTDGVDETARRAARWVKKVKPVKWREFAQTVLGMLE